MAVASTFWLKEKEKIFLVPGGVREQRISLPFPSGGDAAGYSQHYSGWRHSIRFSDKSYVTLLIFSGMLQFMHISTSELGEILKTDNLHAPKYQCNSSGLEVAAYVCFLQENITEIQEKARKRKALGLEDGIELGETLAALGRLLCSSGDYVKTNTIRGDSGWGLSFCTQRQDEARGEQQGTTQTKPWNW